MTERYGGGPVALVGVVVTAVMTIPFALIGAHTCVAFLCVAMFLRGAGMGSSFMPAMTAAFAALDRSEVVHATPQLNVLNRVGGSIGTTILAVVLANALRRRAHAERGGQRLRHRVLVVGRDRRAGDHPVRRPDARRVQCAQGREGRRRARIPTASRSTPAPSRRRSHERHARVRQRDGGSAQVPADPSTPPRRPASWVWRSSGRWSPCAGCAGARPTGPASSATPSTDCCSGWRGVRALGPRAGRARRPLAGDRRPDARAPRGCRAGHAHALRAGSPRRALGSHRARRRSRRRAPAEWSRAGRTRSASSPSDELAAAARVLNRVADVFESLSRERPRVMPGRRPGAAQPR